MMKVFNMKIGRVLMVIVSIAKWNYCVDQYALYGVSKKERGERGTNNGDIMRGGWGCSEKTYNIHIGVRILWVSPLSTHSPNFFWYYCSFFSLSSRYFSGCYFLYTSILVSLFCPYNQPAVGAEWKLKFLTTLKSTSYFLFIFIGCDNE